MQPPMKPDEKKKFTKEGLLWKKARSRRLTSVVYRPWALRWFTLEKGILQYYKEQGLYGNTRETVGDDMSLKGTLLVHGCNVVREQDSSKQFVFEIIDCKNTENGNLETIRLAAPSEQALDEWLAALGNKDILDKIAKRQGITKSVQLRKAVSRYSESIHDLYDIKERLGSGGFSVVKRGIDREDGQVWALKLIQQSVFQDNQERTEEEVKVLASLNHPYIVKLKEIVRTPKFFVIVMEHLKGGELFERIVKRKKYHEHDAKIVAFSILSAIQYLHDNDIVHRDIKPENVLFTVPGDSGELKLTDFGFATMYDPQQKLTSTCGTPEYVAPEILQRKPYGTSVDLWSIGVVIYILLCGFPPFYGDNENQLFERICRGRYQFVRPYWDIVSEDAKNLIQKLLEVDPEKRLTAREALAHVWFEDLAGQINAPVPATSADLTKALGEMKRFNAFRKLKKGVIVVVATNKIKMGYLAARSDF